MAEQKDAGVTLHWTDGLQFVATAEGSKHAIVLDGSPEVGGADTAMRPTEALLCALGSCTAMDVIAVLRKKRLDVTRFSVHLSGERAEEHPRRYTHINLEFAVTGREIPKAAVERAIELSQTKYCSVTATINAEITYSCRIIDADEA